jgi:hypothetical protein
MSGEGFFSRWSRLKRGEAQEPEPQPEAPPAEAAEAAPEPAEQGEAPQEFDLASLPPIESLTAESDISVFLRAGVPQVLRNAALRRAWSLDPVIRDFIGPADYAWDYNAPDGVPGFSATLGGDLKKLLAQAIGEVTEEQAEAAPKPAPAPQETSPEPDASEQQEQQQYLADAPADDPPQAAEQPQETPPPRRRHGGAIPS